VRLYPIAAVSLAALGGYLLGRSRGPELWEEVTTRAADVVTENVHELIGSR
jgi:hypothetical protein